MPHNPLSLTTLGHLAPETEVTVGARTFEVNLHAGALVEIERGQSDVLAEQMLTDMLVEQQITAIVFDDLLDDVEMNKDDRSLIIDR